MDSNTLNIIIAIIGGLGGLSGLITAFYTWSIRKTTTDKTVSETQKLDVETDLARANLIKMYTEQAVSDRKRISDLEKEVEILKFQLDDTIQKLKVLESERISLLKQHEIQFEALFSTIGNPVLIINADTEEILDANSRALSTYGYTKEELVGKKITEISAEPEETAKVMRDRITSVNRRIHKRKDGTEFPVEATLTFYREPGNSHSYCVTEIREIYRRRKSDDQGN